MFFALAVECGRCFISSTVRLGYAEKWPFLMSWSKFWGTGLNSVTWYHCDSSILLLAARALSAAGC